MGEKIIIQKLDELLDPHLNSNEKIIAYDTRAHTAVGENFGSQMVTLDVTITDTETKEERILHLVNKMIPQDEAMIDMFNIQVSYAKEMDFYLKAVPAMLSLQQDCKVPEKDWISNIVPKCFGARIGFGSKVDENAAILLENLRPQGYGLKDKREGLDFNHTSLALEKLAYFHALPIALRDKKHDEYESCILPAAKHCQFGSDPDKNDMGEKLVEVTGQIFEKLSIKSELIKKAKSIISKMNMNFHAELKEPFVTIMHNDLWVNNVLFASDKQNTEIPSRVALIDFQLTTMNSPMCDVLFFMFTSVEPSVRRGHFDELIDVHYQSFCKCLVQVGCDTSSFSKEAFWSEIDRVAAARLFEIVDRLRVIFAEKELLDDPEWFYIVDLGGEELRQRIADILVQYEERGWLNV